VSGSFVYDGDGNRVKGTVSGVTTAYVGNYYEYNVSTGVATSYYYAGATRVAMRQSSTVYYLLGDHLGSTAVTVNSSGGWNGEVRYKAFGETRYNSGSTPTTYRYTGQRQESALGGTDGLYFYGARWYDSALGRFLSADTVVPQAGNPQALNRYSYVNNNPLKHIDPSGHCWGVASGLRGTGAYGATCNNMDMALTIVRSPKTSLGEKAFAGWYLGTEGSMHAAVAVGTAYIGWEYITTAGGAACLSNPAGCSEKAARTYENACGNGQCEDAVQSAVQAVVGQGAGQAASTGPQVLLSLTGEYPKNIMADFYVSLRGHGITAYGSVLWDDVGLSEIPATGGNFPQAFEQAMNNTSRIQFNLTGLDIVRAWKEGSEWLGNNYTSYEFYQIMTHPEWLKKTGFWLNGEPYGVASP